MIRSKLLPVLSLSILLIFGCDGGGNGGGFDPLQGRPATVEDLEGRSFTFAFVANGGPFDPSLGDRPTMVRFSEFDSMSTAPSASFTLETADGAVSGSAMFDNSRLTLTFSGIDPSLPFTMGQEVVLDVLADIDDGRISVTNTVTGLEATSDGNETPVLTLKPGDSFSLGTTDTLSISGTYLLPAGAISITTRCTGSVTVEIPTAMPQTNTCNSPDGSQSITNPVTAASDVTYTFGAGAFARATVN